MGTETMVVAVAVVAGMSAVVSVAVGLVEGAGPCFY